MQQTSDLELLKLGHRRYEILRLLKPVDHMNLYQANLKGAKFDDLIDQIGVELDSGKFLQDAVYASIKNAVNNLGMPVELQDPEWISVEEDMPGKGIRVWASTGPDDIGNDCYFGKKGCTFGEAAKKGFFDFGEECWRRSETQEPAERPETPSERGTKITHWRPLPNAPKHVVTPLFPKYGL